MNARAKAKSWDDQKLPCLGSTYRNAALDFASCAEKEKVCRCGEVEVKKPRIRKLRNLEDDIVPL